MPGVLTDFIGNFEYNNFTPMIGCEMQLPRIHQEFKLGLYFMVLLTSLEYWATLITIFKISVTNTVLNIDIYMYFWFSCWISASTIFPDSSSFDIISSTRTVWTKDSRSDEQADRNPNENPFAWCCGNEILYWNFKSLTVGRPGSLYSGQFFFELPNPADFCLHLLWRSFVL